MNLVLDTSLVLLAILMMAVVGMELEVRQFRHLLRGGHRVLWVLAIQTVALPTLGLVLAGALALPPYLTASLLLVAACPVGDIANFYTVLARGNAALSLALNTVTCLLSAATMAVVFQVYRHVLGRDFVFAAPAVPLVARLVLLLALPVLLGMWLRRVRPHWTASHLKGLRRSCLAGLALLLFYILIAQRERLVADWRQTALAAGLFILLSILGGLGLGWALRFPTGDVITIAIVCAVRNVGLATTIAVALLGRVEYAVFATVYFLTEVPLVLAMVAVYRRCFREPARVTPTFWGAQPGT